MHYIYTYRLKYFWHIKVHLPLKYPEKLRKLLVVGFPKHRGDCEIYHSHVFYDSRCNNKILRSEQVKRNNMQKRRDLHSRSRRLMVEEYELWKEKGMEWRVSIISTLFLERVEENIPKLH